VPRAFCPRFKGARALDTSGGKFYFNPSWRLDYNHNWLQNSLYFIAAAVFMMFCLEQSSGLLIK
jgi:hypothetical protein